MKVNCLIIDDEPSSQNILKSYIEKVPFLDIVGVMDDAFEARDYLAEQSVDLLFLDINMPKLSGVQFYESLARKPKVIFTTAYAKFAIDGFHLGAVDYLLKPFSFDRFLKAVQKIKPKEKIGDSMIIKENKKLHRVKFEEISHVEGLGDYVKVHLNDKVLVTYTSLKKFYLSLPESMFVQIHKSFIINFTKVKYIQGNMVVLKEYQIPIGATFKSDLFDKLNA